MKILDVGCGSAKLEGSIGIDIRLWPGIDAICDLNKYAWPFKEEIFDKIYCRDIIEHLDDVVKTMQEIHRISKKGSKVVIFTPHFAHPNSFRDPTHKWHFTIDSFDYFTRELKYPVYTKEKFKIIKKDFIFRRKFGISAILAKISPRRYEKYYSHRFPPYGLYFELEVLKT
ncbi:MAG: class I SAM-dependent methyltransferase [Candidatus Omnitrophica bacterium]|nr:class I SAM-dependent methyltransferase [Candidatus Omnitrophota bacterium]